LEHSHSDNQARQSIIASIRRHLEASRAANAVYEEAPHEFRDIKTAAGESPIVTETSLLDQFCKALDDVAGHALVVSSAREAAATIEQIFEQHGVQRVAVSNAAIAQEVLKEVRTNASLTTDCRSPELFACDVGVTGAQWAVAETGTLILESRFERHRLASLVPPVHIAIIDEKSIRQTLAEVIQSIQNQGRDDMSRVVTFITGPSRTSDIELTLAIGVHGPAQLYVIIIKSVSVG